jgi:hypothetical protein
MSAVFDSGNPAQAVAAPGQAARLSARAAAVALALVVVAFGVAYAIGSMSKKSSTGPSAGQLAPASALQGQASVHVSVLSGAGAIPALAHVAKPKPAHHAQAQTQANSNQTQSPPVQSTSSPTVQQPVQQPVVQQPVQQQPVVQQPVQHPQQPVVVVHH